MGYVLNSIFNSIIKKIRKRICIKKTLCHSRNWKNIYIIFWFGIKYI